MSEELVELSIDGKSVKVSRGTTILDAAKGAGIEIPALCHLAGLGPVGVCRVCVVDVGERTLAASCIRKCENGMVVETNTAEVEKARKTILSLLMSDYPSVAEEFRKTSSQEFVELAKRAGVVPGLTPFPAREVDAEVDSSSSVIRVDHNACILCERCLRACSEVKSNNIIGRTGKGYEARIGFDDAKPMKKSGCVNCGECLVSCPTAALSLKTGGFEVGESFKGLGEPVAIEELLSLPIFSGISLPFLQRHLEAMVKRTFRKGETICREGAFGDTAFYIVEGSVEIYLSGTLGRVAGPKPEGQSGSPSGAGDVSPWRSAKRDIGNTTLFVLDAPVALDRENPIARLAERDFFGEQSALNFYPRSATVRAAEDCVLLEMLRPVLLILQKNPAFKEEIETKYRERALADQLATMPLFQSVGPEFMSEVRQQAELIRYDPGEVVVREGDPSDALYVVRLGFVKVTKQFADGEIPLAYLHQGDYFGEMGLLSGNARTASCTAVDHVEVVKIGADEVESILGRFPGVEAEMREMMARREAQDETVAEPERGEEAQTMAQFLDQGLMGAQSLLVIDQDECVECDSCVEACADAHGGASRLAREGVRLGRYLVATTCRSCSDPQCMVGCPVGAIRRHDTLEIYIEDWCIGCGQCAKKCPYGNIAMHPVVAPDGQEQGGKKRRAAVCDLCAELGGPRCVDACPMAAARRVSGEDFFRMLSESDDVAG